MGTLRQLACASLFAISACGSPSPGAPDASTSGPGGPLVTTQGTTFGNGWVVTAVDDRGASRFLWATTRHELRGLAARDAARIHVERVAPAFAVTPGALATLGAVREV